MNKSFYLLVLLGGGWIFTIAPSMAVDGSPLPAADGASNPALPGSMQALTALPAAEPPAKDSVLPGTGFDADHYESLWSKSPFSVASPDGPGDQGPGSPDYSLVGVYQFDGVSYACLVNKQTFEHFVVPSDTPVKGLKLVSVAGGHDVASTTATLLKDGQPITLKLETAGLTGSPVPGNLPIPGNLPGGQIPGMGGPPMGAAPYVQPNVLPMPGQAPQVAEQPGFVPGQWGNPRRHMIRIPGPPGQVNQPGMPVAPPIPAPAPQAAPPAAPIPPATPAPAQQK